MEQSLRYMLMKAHTALNKKILSQTYVIGLTAGQPKILEFLTYYNGSDQKTIASYCEIEPATVGSILLRMEEAGLVERKQHDGNLRSHFVFLTEKGRQSALQISDIFSSVERQAVMDLTSDEIIKLKNLLSKLYLNLADKNLV